MQIFEGVGIALGSLNANKGRAALTILGVAIGVAVVMAIASMITGINRGVTAQMEQLGPRTFFVFREFQGGIQVNDGSQRRRHPPLTLEEAERLAALSAIGMLVVDEGTSAEVEFGSETLSSVSVAGRGARWLEVAGGDVFPGRSYTHVEDLSRARVAVINGELKDALFGPLDPIGRQMKIAGVPYRVIGIYTAPHDPFGEGSRPRAFLPHGSFDKFVPHFRGGKNFLVRPVDAVTVQQAVDQVTATMRSMRKLRPSEDNDFAVITQDRMLQTFNDVTGIFFLVMLVLSSVGLMVGGIGVIAIMMISVTERTREIGVRKALGARKREIMWQFLVEAATLTMVGGAVGMGLGGLVSVAVRTFSPLPSAVPLWSVVAAIGASAFTGIVFGLYPAAKAARLDPIEALRYE